MIIFNFNIIKPIIVFNRLCIYYLSISRPQSFKKGDTVNKRKFDKLDFNGVKPRLDLLQLSTL